MVRAKLTKAEKKELRKKKWEMWKGAPWISWSVEKLKDFHNAQRIFIDLPKHIKIGLWREIAMFPVYKGNLAKILDVDVCDVWWKDKYDTPRFEYSPRIQITLFWRWTLLIWWGFKNEDWREWSNDRYWEQYLWTQYYSEGQIDVAETTWPWRNEKDESTWDRKYLRKF